MPFAQLENFKMHYEVFEGIVPRDTLVIHGNLASNKWFYPAVGCWRLNSAKDNHLLPGRLILAEWRGCGKSSPPSSREELNLQTLANDYIELINYLGLRRVSVIGHSTGAAIALLAMSRAPQLFDRAVLLDPVAPKGNVFGQAVLDGFARMKEDRDFCKAKLSVSIHENEKESVSFDALVDDAFNVASENWLGIPFHLSKLDITNEVRTVEHPVYILHGEFDPVIPLEVSRELEALLPNGKFIELKNQGHSACFENPTLFVKLTDSFLYA